MHFPYILISMSSVRTPSISSINNNNRINAMLYEPNLKITDNLNASSSEPKLIKFILISN